MFRFIKDNSYTVFKMFVNQIGMTFLGLVLTMATANYDKWFLASSIFASVFYMVLLYTMTWEAGYEHSRKIDAGRMDLRPLGGLEMSLFANIINIVLAILVIIGFYCATSYNFYSGQLDENGAAILVSDMAQAVGKSPASPVWAVNLFGTSKTLAVFLNAMYGGIINRFFNYSPWAYIIIVIPSLLVCTLAYYLGAKGVHFTKFLGEEPKKE